MLEPRSVISGTCVAFFVTRAGSGKAPPLGSTPPKATARAPFGQLPRLIVSVAPAILTPAGSIITPVTRVPAALAGLSAVTGVIVIGR